MMRTRRYAALVGALGLAAGLVLAGPAAADVAAPIPMADPEPGVACTPERAVVGEPRECTFTPAVDGVDEYTYKIDDGPERTVAAQPDGTATVTIVPTAERHFLFVESVRDADKSLQMQFMLVSAANPPEVSCRTGGAADERQCTFRTRMADTERFAYQVGSAKELTVVADRDGTATVTVIVDRRSGTTLTVWSVAKDGRRSAAWSDWI